MSNPMCTLYVYVKNGEKAFQKLNSIDPLFNVYELFVRVSIEII